MIFGEDRTKKKKEIGSKLLEKFGNSLVYEEALSLTIVKIFAFCQTNDEVFSCSLVFCFHTS